MSVASNFNFGQIASDGILGMAFQRISADNWPPVFQTLIMDGQTSASSFGFKLASSGSELFLGGVNNQLVSGPFTFANVIDPVRGSYRCSCPAQYAYEVSHFVQSFWQIPADSINVNGNTVTGGLTTIIDTGTTQIVCDSSTIAAIYKNIPGAQEDDSLGQGMFTC